MFGGYFVKRSVIIMTIISLILFCFIMITVSIEPYPYSNEFNSPGMWKNILVLFFFYLLSLGLYMRGMKIMKYVMAISCGFGLAMALTLIVSAFVIGMVQQNIADYSGTIVLCMAALIFNSAWYNVTFSKNQAG